MGSAGHDTALSALEGPAYWYATSGQDLERMMQLAGIPETAQHHFLDFYRNILCPTLGDKPSPPNITSHPTQRGSLLGWDGNPFEYSFEFKGSTKKCGVRFAADLTQHRPNDVTNPLGMSHARSIINHLRTRTPGFDSTWNDAFNKFFSVEDLPSKQQEALITKIGFQTPMMLGFDIKPAMLDSPPDNRDIVPVMLKSYYLPHYTTMARNLPSTFDAIKASIHQLPNVSQTSPNILKALDLLDSYISNRPNPEVSKNSAVFMATDFISPSKARLKIYFRFYNPNPGEGYRFEDIWEYYTLGGRIPDLEGDKPMLRDLIDLVGGHTQLTGDSPGLESTSDWRTNETRVNKTRKKVIVLYFSLTPDKPYPTPKVYYNPAHSSKLPDDLSIARGIDAWMEKYGWNDGGLSVQERVQSVFSHRRLEEKNGLFTFIAFGPKEDGGNSGEGEKKKKNKAQTSLSVYVTPELYENPRF